MTSYFSSLSSRYTSLKRLLPSHNTPESDNSCTDPADSHVSRVLRAYYTEKGRPFPPWLGPDPNAPVKATPALIAQPKPSSSTASSLRSHRSGASGLGELFNDSLAQAPLQEETLSLRSRRPVASANVRPPAFKGGSSDAIPYPSRTSPGPQPTARPLPSQRLGSYQNRSSTDSGRDSGFSVAKEPSATDRLRARLGGYRAASPGLTSSSNGFGDSSAGGRGGFNPYEDSGGGFNPYESRGGGHTGGISPYDSAPSGDGRNYGDSSFGNPYSAGRTQPYTAASSPWVSGDDHGLGGDLGAGGRGPGLPSSPRRKR